MSRIESGPIQFGDDWPGLFLRGDDCFNFAMHLKILLDRDGSDKGLSHFILRSFLDDLQSTNVHNDTPVCQVQLLKPAEECVKSVMFSNNPELKELLEKYKRKLATLSSEQLAALKREHAIDWAYGEMKLKYGENPSITRERIAEIYDQGRESE